MKLLQINATLNSGSTGRIAEGIGRFVKSRGWHSSVAYGRKMLPSVSEPLRIGNMVYIYCHVFQTRFWDRHGLGSKRATIELLKQIESNKPDIIHLHNLHGYYLNIEILFNYLSSLKTPIVWTLHDCWAFTGHCTHFAYSGCDRWQTKCFECPQKMDYPATLWIDRSRKNFELKNELFNSLKDLTIIPVSSWLSNIVSQSFLKDYPTRIINNGLDTTVFSPLTVPSHLNEKFHLNGKMVLLGVANVWSERKGLLDFIRLSKKLPSDTIIILVGLSKKQKNGLPKNIIGIEHTESVRELVEIYNLADLVLNLSVEETFGMTTVEGFACGVPGIVYNTTASPELITPDTGFVVDSGDIYAVLDCVEKIKEKGKEYYKSTCRERVLNFYDREKNYAKYFELYNELIGKKESYRGAFLENS